MAKEMTNNNQTIRVRYNSISEIPLPNLLPKDKLEEGIIPLVLVLRAFGCKTIESCAGHMCNDPTAFKCRTVEPLEEYNDEGQKVTVKSVPEYYPSVMFSASENTISNLSKAVIIFNGLDKIEWALGKTNHNPPRDVIVPIGKEEIKTALDEGNRKKLVELESKEELLELRRSATRLAKFIFNNFIARKDISSIIPSDNEIKV